jgi:hypothetical protein
MEHLNLEVIQQAVENDRKNFNFGERLRYDQVYWLIEQTKKVKKYEKALKDVIEQPNPKNDNEFKMAKWIASQALKESE